MLAVIFEVSPRADKRSAYFDVAASLRSELEQVDGFISVERFSLSFWRDEAAVEAWRNRDKHRAAQAEGRNEIFQDYRLRVASVVRDYGMSDRAQAPDDSRRVHP